MIALATPPRCLGRPRHVQLLLFLGNVGEYWTEAFILNDGSLIDLRPLVEGPIGQVHAIVPGRTGVTEYWIGLTASLCFDAGELHHLAPFLGFVGNELAKIGGRARQRDAAEVVKPRL